MTGTFGDELAQRLRGACDAARVASASVALSRGGTRFSVGRSEGKLSFSTTSPVLIGCLAKPLTATLLWQLIARDNRFTLDSQVGPVLSPNAPELLSGITLTHLLNHSHGLQDSYRTEVPLDPRGFIHITDLLDDIRANGRLFQPGRTYSYGNAGYWLAGAFIESLTQRPLRDVLVTELLQPLGISLLGSGFCPSFGNEAMLTAAALLTVAERQITDEQFRELRERSVAYPGWISTSRDSPCGWVNYGEGWFGQNSILESHSAVIRFSPQKHIALVVTSPTTKAFLVMASVFGEVLPELTRNITKPRALTPAEINARDWSTYVRDYRGGAATISVRRSPRAATPLQLTIRARNAAPILVHLRPAEHGVFFAVPSAPGFASVQFVSIGDDSAPMLWNGTHLWRGD